MPEEIVYVVMGETGEYSGFLEWTVCAYHDESLAQEHVRLASAQARVSYACWQRLKGQRPAPNVYDPNMRMDYGGTTYTYERVPVRTALPLPESPKPLDIDAT